MNSRRVSIVAILLLLVGSMAEVRGGQLLSRADLQAFFGGPGELEDFQTFDVADGTFVNLDCVTLNATATCNGQGPGLVEAGIDVSFGTSSGNLVGPGGFDGGPSKEISSSGQPLIVDFTTLTYAFGVDVRNSVLFPSVASIDVYGSDDSTLLGSIGGLDLSSGNPLFVGWSDLGGIGKIEFRQTQPWSPAIDNLEFGAFLASTQATYEYVGNTFTLFSCASPYFICPSPGPGESSYTTSNFVTTFIRVDEPLPAGLLYEDISGFAGFHLIMTDGRQQLAVTERVRVSTDSNGDIVAPWWVSTIGPVPPNNGILTLNQPEDLGVRDVARLSAPTESLPDIPADMAWAITDPGSWTKSLPSPEMLANRLIGDIEELVATFQLKLGHANGLTQPLKNALRGLEQGKTSAACSQLQHFIDKVNVKTPKVLLVPTAEDLIAGANAVRASLGCSD